jgi:hypothetical protein
LFNIYFLYWISSVFCYFDDDGEELGNDPSIDSDKEDDCQTDMETGEGTYQPIQKKYMYNLFNIM